MLFSNFVMVMPALAQCFPVFLLSCFSSVAKPGLLEASRDGGPDNQVTTYDQPTADDTTPTASRIDACIETQVHDPVATLLDWKLTSTLVTSDVLPYQLMHPVSETGKHHGLIANCWRSKQLDSHRGTCTELSCKGDLFLYILWPHSEPQ